MPINFFSEGIPFDLHQLFVNRNLTKYIGYTVHPGVFDTMTKINVVFSR